MKQDIKFNLWVLVSAFVQGLVGIVCVAVGALLSIMGMFSTDKLLKFKELKFLVNQEGLINLQNKILGRVLINKYIFLIIGIIIAVIGIVSLAIAIVELILVRKYEVVNHRGMLTIFSLIPLIVAGCVEAYLLLQYNVLKSDVSYIKNIKMLCFAICGVFSICAILKLLGILFSQSEEFASRENGKYVFEGVKGSITQQAAQASNTKTSVRAQNPANQPAAQVPGAQRTLNAIRPQATQGYPRPQSARPNVGQSSTQSIRTNPALRPGVNPQAARQVTRQSDAQSLPRPNSAMTRPAQLQGTARPAATSTPAPKRPQPAQLRRCPKCGRALLPSEKICSSCGYKGNN